MIIDFLSSLKCIHKILMQNSWEYVCTHTFNLQPIYANEHFLFYCRNELNAHIAQKCVENFCTRSTTTTWNFCFFINCPFKYFNVYHKQIGIILELCRFLNNFFVNQNRNSKMQMGNSWVSQYYIGCNVMFSVCIWI